MGSDVVESVRGYIDSLDRVREEFIKRSRDLLQTVRRAVLLCVKRRVGEASKLVEEASKLYGELKELASKAPEILYSNLFYSVATEYVEAVELYSILSESRIRGAEELGVHPVPFLLGLADVIGELKRVSLELLAEGKEDESRRLLEVAESIYESLMGFAEYPDAILPGLRRKLDVYRKVLGDWREILVDLSSRRRLEEALKALKSELSSKG